MELVAYEMQPGRVEIRPAPRRREWMDGTHAYHCLPLVMANLHGWEMLCPFACEVTWRGGEGIDQLEIVSAQPAGQASWFESHFGSGILTFKPMVVMRTPPGINLWVTGPINSFKDGIQPLTASIETDWLPFTFTMNWKLTRPNHRIRFAKDEPFCAFFPITRGLVGACEPRLARVTDEPVLARSIEWGNARRELESLVGETRGDLYQRWYAKGEFPEAAAGRAPDDHETTIVARPFRPS